MPFLYFILNKNVDLIIRVDTYTGDLNRLRKRITLDLDFFKVKLREQFENKIKK